MEVSEIISEVRRLEIRTRMVVDEIIGGAYHSRFKGRGIEFDEVREYIPGDDVRDIDWNVTARMGTPFIKKYVEERELHVLLVVDVSASGLFGSGEKTKIRTQTELAALLALSAVRNNDKVGMITFSDRVEAHLPMRSGRSHVLRMLRELVATEPQGRETNLAEILTYLRRFLKKRTVIFFISDFCDDPEKWSKPLRMLAQKHDVTLLQVSDPVEQKWVLPGIWNFEDAETCEQGTFYTNSSFQRELELKSLREREIIQGEALRAKAGWLPITCGDDLIQPLMRYFSQRLKS